MAKNTKIRKANYLVGTKFYRYDENDNLIMLRVVRIKNEDTIVVKEISYNNPTVEFDKTIYHMPKLEPTIKIFPIKKKELFDNYTKLLSDGIMIFNIITIRDMEDVVVTLMRRKDIENRIQVPYVICRQNVKDFHDYLIKTDWAKTDVGTCISQDTIPNGCDFRELLVADNIIQSNIVNVYLDDSLDDILEYVNTLNYDHCLAKIFDLAKEHANTFNYPFPRGYWRTLRDLLNDNDFMDDFDRGFNIIDVDFIIEEIPNNQLYPDDMQRLEDLTGQKFLGHFICPFEKTIDLSRISYDYKLIRDKVGALYIMIYGESQNVLPSYAQYHQDILASMYSKIPNNNTDYDVFTDKKILEN